MRFLLKIYYSMLRISSNLLLHAKDYAILPPQVYLRNTLEIEEESAPSPS
jgi:hypothetical protein